MPDFPGNPGEGIFIPQDYNFDVTDLEGKDLGSLEFKEFIIRITQAINIMSITINQKKSGINDLEELPACSTLFPDTTLSSETSQYPEPRQIFNKTINFCDGTVVDSLPNNGATSVPHGIDIPADGAITFTSIYATASQVNTSFIPIPYSSVTSLSDNIQIDVDNTNVTITTGSDRTNYTFCYVFLEYIKQ